MPDLSQQIEDAVGGPKKVEGDAATVEQHPIPHLIEADRYLNSKEASNAGALQQIRRTRTRPPGAV